MSDDPRAAAPVGEAAALWFRTRRACLAGDGAPDAAAAARAILGAQAQQEAPALFALCQRTAGRPPAEALRLQLVGERPPRLVRTWGQRDTLHVYPPDDWAAVVAARREWPQSGRRGAMPTAADLAAAGRRFARAGGPLFRRDLFDAVSERYLEEVARHPAAGREPLRLATTRLIWRLAAEGDVCLADRQGSQVSYVHRRTWFPDLPWPDAPDARDAATALARRYLATYAPATAADLAHFFGAKVSTARRWLARLEGEVTAVRCGERRGLLALTRDLDELAAEPPRGAGWPPRLLPKWDTHLMTHRDKSWTVPEAAEAPRVWRKAADISATVLARGRVVATWTHRATRKRVALTVSPLAGWRASHLAGVRREAAVLAAHLGVAAAEVAVE